MLRLGNAILRHPLITLVTIAATVVSSILVIASAVIGLGGWFERTFDWRDHEYEKLVSLHAGFSRERFVEVLGTPEFDRRSEDGKLREQTFKGREYWVQAVSDRSGAVLLYSVTACSEEFKPTFYVPGASGDGDQPAATITLNESRLDAVRALEIDYYPGLATGSARFLHIFYGGNYSNYKTLVWGRTDGCRTWPTTSADLGQSSLPGGRSPIYLGDIDKAPPWTLDLQASVLVNTFAETAPLVDLDPEKLRRIGFELGADRVLTRTVFDPGATQPPPDLTTPVG